MTTNRTAGDLTALWMDNEDSTDTATGAVIAVRDDPDALTPMDLCETQPDADVDAIALPERTGAPRSPKAERRRAERQYAQSQRRARESVLQVLFEVDLVGHSVEDVGERQFEQMLLTDDARKFAERLVNGVLGERTGLDILIASLAPTWPTDQLPRVDINVLRLALYELLAEQDTPTGAIINEAVELAKQYGSENSGRFVNGVLGTVAARLTAGTMQRSIDMIHVT